MASQLKIALLGTRGIPASYGGFETCVEEIGKRLVEKGHIVWVYSKRSPQNDFRYTYLGMRIMKIPRINIQGFETLVSTIISVIHSLFYNFDIHMVFNGANSPALIFYKLLKKTYALNTDGLEWKREKWGRIGRNYYKCSERISVLLCRNLVSDSQAIHDYYLKKYNANSTIIAYGATRHPFFPEEKVNKYLNELGLKHRKYILQITRFEPENNPLLTLMAFTEIKNDFNCVIIGGVNYPTHYVVEMEKVRKGDARIILPGFLYDRERLEVILQNAYCYIHGNSVGGTNPALLQAMAAGRPVIALDCIFNREVLGENGYYFERNQKSLRGQIEHIIDNRKKAEEKARKALDRIDDKYNWELITAQYEAMFASLIKSR